MHFPPPLDSLSAIENMVLEKYVETVNFSRGNEIFHAGDAPDGCYIIDEGVVRIESDKEGSDPDDHDNVLAFLETGTFLGELSLLDRLPRSATAIAQSDIVVRRISFDGFNALVKDFPQIGVSLVSALGRAASLKLRSTTERLDNLIGSKFDAAVETMLTKAEDAQREIIGWSEERIDTLLGALAMAFAEQAEALAEAAVAETEIGNVVDKTLKNKVASLGVFDSLMGRRGYGLLDHDVTRNVVEMASPVGIIFGLVPVTNPTSTFIFKTLISIKSRNALILSPNRKALESCTMAGEIVHRVLREHGAPTDLVQWIKGRNSRKQVVTFMSHKKVGLVLATGGPSVVKAAYSSGNPAIGVGSGNAPALICADADIEHAAASIVTSKSFDHGLICGSEHNLVVLDSVYDSLVDALERSGAAVLNDHEGVQFALSAVDLGRGIFKEEVIGRSAAGSAAAAGIERPFPIRLIVVPMGEVDLDNPFSREKMAPILSLFRVPDFDTGLKVSRELLEVDGRGHTAIIHTRDEALIQRFAMLMPASRILINSPGAHGVVGMTTGLIPSLTLGCGTFGHTSTTDNVTYTHMMNVKRLAYYAPERLAQLNGAL
ncbi:MAG: aldehyde dehydrogenase family protein [Chloroflexi bacterium]|nr:aldehyde dehydrogenase family protein [Chloroflexota bacterium]